MITFSHYVSYHYSIESSVCQVLIQDYHIVVAWHTWGHTPMTPPYPHAPLPNVLDDSLVLLESKFQMA